MSLSSLHRQPPLWRLLRLLCGSTGYDRTLSTACSASVHRLGDEHNGPAATVWLWNAAGMLCSGSIASGGICREQQHSAAKTERSGSRQHAKQHLPNTKYHAAVPGIACSHLFTGGTPSPLRCWHRAGPYGFINAMQRHHSTKAEQLAGSCSQQHEQQKTSAAGTAAGMPADLLAALAADKVIIYKGPWILPFRLLVRAKVFQLVGCSAVAIACSVIMSSADAAASDIAVALALAGCCAAASYSLWYYSRRYVGELALLQRGSMVRFSVLDFWGNREDVDVPVESVRPLFKGVRQGEIRRVCSQTLFPVDVHGDRQYYLSARHGDVFDKALLMALLDGSLKEQIGSNQGPAPQQKL